MTAQDVVIHLDTDIERWYEGQRKESVVNRNVMAVGLIMCEHMRSHFPLDESEWFTGSQVRLLGGSRIDRILAQHGENRRFASEGGRTSRGSQYLARSFADMVNGSPAAVIFNTLDNDDRDVVVEELQRRMVDRIRADFFNRQRLEVEIEVGKHTRRAIESLLDRGADKGGNAAGAVVQHLVGAKLHIRYPDLEIENQSYTTADQQTGRFGDFKLNDTAIHVTMSPTEALLAKCQDNIAEGYRPMILTPAGKIEAARGLAENLGIHDSVTVRGIEEFVAGNVDEMAVYSAGAIQQQLRELLEAYNRRVAEVEPDQSLLVQIPENLAGGSPQSA